MSLSVPIELLLQCQKTSYELLEDMRCLYEHPIVSRGAHSELVSGYSKPEDRFLMLVNRTSPAEKQWECECLREEAKQAKEKTGEETLHGNLLLTHGPTALHGNASRLLEQCVDTLGERESNPFLPPPLWLRLLTVCCSIVSDQSLFPPNSARLQWISFSVETPDTKWEDRVLHTANINSYKNRYGIALSRNTHTPEGEGPRVTARALTNVLFDLTKAASALPGELENSSILPYVSFGVRFRTVVGKADHRCIDKLEKRPFIELVPELDNIAASQGDLPERIRLRNHADICAPFPLDEKEWTDYVRTIVRYWIRGHNRDLNLSLDQESEQVSNYCAVIRSFYHDKRWPSQGVDTLLCPALFWSSDPKYLGTTATIFWGFEGLLTDEQCKVLLMLSQTLLSGLGQFSRYENANKTALNMGRASGLHSSPAAFSAAIQDLRDHEEECSDGFRVPIDFYWAALEAAAASATTDTEFYKSLCRIPDIENELKDSGLTKVLIEQKIVSTIARRLAESRLGHQRDPIVNPKKPEVIVEGHLSPGDLKFQGRDLSIFPGLLVMFLKEAIEHTERFLVAAPDAPLERRVIRVQLDSEQGTVTILNPCFPNTDPRAVSNSNQTRSTALLEKHLKSWAVHAPTVQNGWWSRKLSRREEVKNGG